MAEKGKAFFPDLSKIPADKFAGSRRFFPGFLISNLRQINITSVLMELGTVSECLEGVQENFAQESGQLTVCCATHIYQFNSQL